MQTDNLLRTILDNGLTILTREVHSAPVTSVWMWYRVGSREERSGLTGLSHWVEHMLFKPTPTFPTGFDQPVEREGGHFNGMTWLDWTAYYETLPSDRIDLALRIEAERLSHARFDADEVESERTVIIAEREGHENSPSYLLAEQVKAMCFLTHPYRHQVLGWKEDLQRISRDDLHDHYRRHYTPDNAVLVAVGDFETEPLLARIRELFGASPRGGVQRLAGPVEPAARGERRIRMEGPGGSTFIAIAHPAPAAKHPDFFPMVVLDAVLDGAKGLPPFGGGSMGRAARLYRSLVNTQLAVSASSSISATRDPYLSMIWATVHPQQTPEIVEAAILAELQRLQDEPVSADEIQRAIKGARAQFAFASETVSNQARWLGFSEMVASTDWLASFLDNLAAVTPADIQRVAQHYWHKQGRVVGWYVGEQ